MIHRDALARTMTTVSVSTPRAHTHHGHVGTWSSTWSFGRHSTGKRLSRIVTACVKKVHRRANTNHHGPNRSVRTTLRRDSIARKSNEGSSIFYRKMCEPTAYSPGPVSPAVSVS